MTPRKTVKRASRPVRLVGVITSAAELRRAARMKHPPDLFEIRLDHFSRINQGMADEIARISAPLIFTARALEEGGARALSPNERAELLRKFLPWASYIDVELGSARALRDLLASARRQRVGCILSFHDFHSTPTLRSLCTKAERARRLRGDVFKVAARTDSREQLQRLLDFVQAGNVNIPLAVMGMGRLALESRVRLSAAGSIFAYASIGRPRVAGQPTLAQLRSALNRRPKRLL